MICGLYGRELAAIDGSKFKAMNGKDRNFTEKKPRDRIKRIDEKTEELVPRQNYLTTSKPNVPIVSRSIRPRARATPARTARCSG